MHFRKEFLPYFLIIGFFFIILATAFIFSFSGNNPTQTIPQPTKLSGETFSPEPEQVDTQNLQYHPDSNTKAQTIDDASQKMLDKDSLIGSLLSKLPYQGSFFTLEYSYQTNSFTANLSPNNQPEANEEFDEFLKSNQIENRNWLYNLKINNQ